MSAKKYRPRARSIKKGVSFDRFRSDSKPERVRAHLPAIVTIPLKQGFGSENPSLVKKGDKVRAGQIIGRDDACICSPVHSSVSGKVVDVTEISYVHEHLKEDLREKIRAVVVETAGEKLEEPLEGGGPGWEGKEPKKIRQLLYLGGVTCLGQTGIPTEYGSSPVSPREIKNIIINGINSEPFIYSTVQFPEETHQYVSGLQVLLHIFPEATVHAAVDRSTFRCLNIPLGSLERTALYLVDTNHPHGLPEILIRHLLGEKLTYGTFPTDKGILVLGEADLLSIYQAVVGGKPFIRKRLSIAGWGIKRQVVLDAPVGISLEEALGPFVSKKDKFLLMIGGALTGSHQKDLSLPVGKEIDSVSIIAEKSEREFLFFLRPGRGRPSYSRTFLSSVIPTRVSEADVNLHGEERPCISCGFCREVCPVNILPHQIHRCFTHDLMDEVERLRPLECIDCGLCSYVCPSKLPLSEVLKESKSTLSQEFNFVAYHQKEGRLRLYKDFYRIQ